MAETTTNLTNDVIEQIWSLQVSPQEKYMLLSLVGLVPFDGTDALIPTKEAIARTGYTESHVGRALRGIQKRGLLTLTRRRGNTGYLHSFIKIHLSEPIRDQAEYIYVFESGDLFKIGRSRNPQNRLTNINSTLRPHSVLASALLTIECEDSRQLEKELHRHFRFKRQEGEWFKLNTDDVRFLRAFRTQYLVAKISTATNC